MSAHPGYTSWKHESDKVIVFERAGLVFVVNLNSNQSFADYKVGVWYGGTYRPVLDTDSKEFGGQGRVDLNGRHESFPHEFAGRRNHFCVYSPCRTAQIYARIEEPENGETKKE